MSIHWTYLILGLGALAVVWDIGRRFVAQLSFNRHTYDRLDAHDKELERLTTRCNAVTEKLAAFGGQTSSRLLSRVPPR